MYCAIMKLFKWFLLLNAVYVSIFSVSRDLLLFLHIFLVCFASYCSLVYYFFCRTLPFSEHSDFILQLHAWVMGISGVLVIFLLCFFAICSMFFCRIFLAIRLILVNFCRQD